MSLGKEDAAAAQIVIIRRRADDQDEGSHSSGVWKIAYADFMTAMMAFFLVMWLINATDPDVRQGIATYFNPMQIAQEEPQAKGLSDAQVSVDRDPDAEPLEGKQKIITSGGSANLKVEMAPTGQDLFQDPYDVLERLAQRASKGDATKADPRADRGPKSTDEVGSATVDGPAYRDPFDPVFRSEKPPARPSDAVGVGGESVADGGSAASSSERIAILNTEGTSTATQNVVSEADQLRTELAAALSDGQSSDGAGPGAGTVGPTIEVKVDDNQGVLISLTDNSNFGMFAIASSEPQPEMVELMRKVAGVLNARKGNLIVRGHTDARPFRSGTNDNWRLSMARAHIAFHMLVHSGLDENRVDRIEGYADRQLKVKDDPQASQNRRIEILLRQGDSN
jgi:chemotaxis protein MotB